MKPEWKTFLEDAGAEFVDETVESFGNEIRERKITHTGDLLCDLSHYGLIAAYGADALKFLQNQLSNDVDEVDLEHSQISALCTPKGRMLSSFRLFKREETYYLILPYELLETTLNRLRMFVMRSKVTLEDASESLVRIGIKGLRAAEQCQGLSGSLPGDVDGVVQSNGFTIIKTAGEEPRYIILGLLDDMMKLWQAVDVYSAPVGKNAWELLNIDAGIPVVFKETSETFIPQMVNLQLVNGISFTKGCYPGQEIVARMHYLGKLKKRMYRVHIETDNCPIPGEKLFARDSSAGKDTGAIVNARLNSDGSVDALAVIQIADAESVDGRLMLGGAEDAEVSVLALPYSFEVSEE